MDRSLKRLDFFTSALQTSNSRKGGWRHGRTCVRACLCVCVRACVRACVCVAPLAVMDRPRAHATPMIRSPQNVEPTYLSQFGNNNYTQSKAVNTQGVGNAYSHCHGVTISLTRPVVSNGQNREIEIKNKII